MKGAYIKFQFILFLMLYILFLPFSSIVLSYVEWPKILILMFLPILILEHLNQEIFRLLVAMSEQITASITLFIRHASWVLLLIILMYFKPESRHLGNILYFWAIAGIFSIIIY